METDAGREAWLCIAQLFRSKEHERRFGDIADTLDITPSMLGGLLCLVPGEPKPMRAMVEEWHCDPSWVTSVVDDLEARGLVERRVDPVDRRAKTVTLSGLGERQRQHAFEMLSVPPPGIATLSAQEQRTLRDLLRKVTVHLPPLR